MQTSHSQTAADLAAQVAEILRKPRDVEGIALDTAYFAATGAAARPLLPHDHEWLRPSARLTGVAGATASSRVPLQLCEFLAYKAALAYETEGRIRAYLEQCSGPGYSDVVFFDSASDSPVEADKLLQQGRKAEAEALVKAGKEADAQAYGFVFERKAFLVFRGTVSGKDWGINRSDALTSDVRQVNDARHHSLGEAFGPLLDRLGDRTPGRHVGFSIAWAALKHEVEEWLAGLLEERAIDRIVYTGHSLGGAMAQIAAFDHARIESELERQRGILADHIGAVVTFGAPAVGGKDFAREYQRLLGSRTVLLESSGDLVPRIMGRWYYRMLYPLRQRVQAGVQAHLQEGGSFRKVVETPWTFASEPPLSKSDIDNALSGLREAGRKLVEQRQKELAEQAKKVDDAQQRDDASKQREEQKKKDDGAHSAKPPQGGTLKSREQSKSANGKKNDEMPAWLYYVLIGFAILTAAGITWYFVRRKLFSHDIEQRYALYLSTLSYQHLRAKHGGDLDAANGELAEHLRFIRGDLAASETFAKLYPDAEGKHRPYFASVQGLPLPIVIRPEPEFIDFLRKADTFV